jgi:hypothetical protein
VFSCQHALHADRLIEMSVDVVGVSKRERFRELQKETGKGLALGERMGYIVRELDELVAEAHVLCSEMAVKRIVEALKGDL